MEMDRTINPALEELRCRVQKNKDLDKRRMANDPFLSRYLRYNDGNAESAEKMIQRYTDYHSFNGAGQRLTKMTNIPKELIHEFQFKLGGRDHDNRPVFMIPDASTWSVKKYLERGDSAILLRYIMNLRKQMTDLCVTRNVDAGTILINVEHLQYSQYFHKKSISFVIELCKLTQLISPGECKRLVIVNAPRILKMLVESIKKLTTVRADIVLFDSSDKYWKEDLNDYFPMDGIISEFGGTLNEYVEP